MIKIDVEIIPNLQIKTTQIYKIKKKIERKIHNNTHINI